MFRHDGARNLPPVRIRHIAQLRCEFGSDPLIFCRALDELESDGDERTGRSDEVEDRLEDLGYL